MAYICAIVTILLLFCREYRKIALKIVLNDIMGEIKLIPNLILQPDKTQIYKYKDTTLKKL